MIARPLPARTSEEVARLVRALGSHRYVAGRLLLVHTFVFDAVAGSGAVPPELAEACVWAAEVLGSSEIDASSRDERLHRRATERELGAALSILWADDDRGDDAREHLEERLEAIGAPVHPTLFDESAEDEVFPALVDAGWELLPLSALEPERHRGAIDAFGDPTAFERAKLAEAEGDAPPHLHELPLLGPAELLYGVEHVFRDAMVLWTCGDETYDDYVLRGVLRAAKLD